MSRKTPEEVLVNGQDQMLARVISTQLVRWPTRPSEKPIWGLLRIIMAQQVATAVACQIADRAIAGIPGIVDPSPLLASELAVLRTLGMPERRAMCCIEVVQRSAVILRKIESGETWEQALTGIKGIGPWTLSVFRIMVLREPDVLPLGDVGLTRAIRNVYGRHRNVERLGELWRPYRSVACWYLWRTLGNAQLG
jgi:DNA-3-methyladenine glycosylase II